MAQTKDTKRKHSPALTKYLLADLAPIGRIPTGIAPFDLYTGGGLPRSALTLLTGPEGCLDKDTKLLVEVRYPDGSRISHKHITIEHLWERFHCTTLYPIPKGKFLRTIPPDVHFFTSSINEEQRIVTNRICNVVQSGTQECFLLTTLSGHAITATADHRFFNGSQYVRLADLSPGDQVFLNTRTPFRKEAEEERPLRNYLYVKHHPIAGAKTVYPKGSPPEGYTYKKLARSRAVIEAHINKFPSLEAYVQCLNTGSLEGIQFLTRDKQVHHIDEDPTNDAIENLKIFRENEHSRHHALQNHNNLRYVVTPDIIFSIVPVGPRQTYDLQMLAPFNNYIANKFVVHNSGKTTVATRAMAGFLNSTPDDSRKILYINADNKIDADWCVTHGCDTSRIEVMFPESSEEAQFIVKDVVKERADVSLVVIDSLAALCPDKESAADPQDEFMAISARLNNRFIRVLTALQLELFRKQRELTIIIINQEREGMGLYKTTVIPGGKAQRFHAALWCQFFKSDNKIDEKMKIPLLTTLRFKLVKNVGNTCNWPGEAQLCVTPFGHHRIGQFLDQEFVWLWAVQRFHIATNRGAKGYEYRGKTKTKTEWIEQWETHPETYVQIKQDLQIEFAKWLKGDLSLIPVDVTLTDDEQQLVQ